MLYTEFEVGLMVWLFIAWALLAAILVSFFGQGKQDWSEIKRLRADKEALTEILLKFLRGQIETLPSKAKENTGEEHK